MIPPPQTGPKKKSLKYTVKKMLNQSKAALAEACEEAAMEQGLQGYPQVGYKLDSIPANGESPFSTKCPTQHIRHLTAVVRYPKSYWKLPVQVW